MEARNRISSNRGSGDYLKIKERAKSPTGASRQMENINDWHGPSKKQKQIQSSDFLIAQWENESEISANIAQLFEKEMV